MFVFMVTGQREERARTARRRLIIVGANGSAAAEAAAQCAVEKPSFARMTCCSSRRTSCRSSQRASSLHPLSADVKNAKRSSTRRQAPSAVPPTMCIDQLIEIDSVESLLPRLSERAELTALGKINQHSAGRGHSGIPPAPPPSCLDIPSWQCLAAGRHEQMTVAPTALTRMGSIPRGISITSSA
jgi:hypothetical protein